ncbi:MAG: DoxX family protein [Parvibaculales bacterium]
MPKVDEFALPIGRSLLAAYFILPGIAKFAAWQMHIELMHHHNLPFAEVLLFLAGIANLILGGLLLANRHARLAAYGCVLYIILVNFNLHDFWNFSGIDGAHETQNFFKNLGILAGCLMLAGFTARQEKRD